MLITKHIGTTDDRLLNGLTPLVQIMSLIEQDEEESIVLDFSEAQSVSPVFVLALMVYASQVENRLSFANIPPALETIGLSSGGMKPDRLRRSEFLAQMEGFVKKTHIPIINFPALAGNDEKEIISSVVEDLMIRQMNIPSNVATGLKYMVGEILDNITEHSESDRGYVFAQAFPEKGYLDLCVADRGISLLGSYRRLENNEIESDIEALRAANRGISSKNLPDAENRGYGIYTTKKMLVEGLGGQYLMLSGNALYMEGAGYDNFYTFPEGIRWNGTIVALRIPCHGATFNYVNYIE